jgi:TPR repeat protein
MYFAGIGIARDRAKSKAWLQKAAEQTEDKEVREKAKIALQEWF